MAINKTKVFKETSKYEEYTTKLPINKFNSNETDNTGENSANAVTFVETKYPKTAKEFKRLQREQYELFCKKQMDYGPSNISVGTDLSTEADIKLSLTGLWFRMNDKIQRLKNLLMSGQEANNEPLEDSFLDVSNYGIMATIVNNKKWGK